MLVTFVMIVTFVNYVINVIKYVDTGMDGGDALCSLVVNRG